MSVSPADAPLVDAGGAFGSVPVASGSGSGLLMGVPALAVAITLIAGLVLAGWLVVNIGSSSAGSTSESETSSFEVTA